MYWKIPVGQSLKTIDRKFKLHKGLCVQNVHWVNIAKKSSNNPNYIAGKSTYPGFALIKSYTVPEWIEYSRLKAQQFKFLTIKV